MIRLLYLAFALSGGAGLIYEAVWGRYMALFVGHSAYAQVLVIATYLGGMALGALAVGEGVKKLQAPLLWYAGAEAGLALLGLLFHPLFQGLTGFAYTWLFPTLADPGWVAAGKWTLALGLLLPQAVLLGTTFPLMSSGVLRGFSLPPGRTLSILYFTNSFGAALGVLVGGFFLVGWVGLPGSLAVAALLNLVAAGIALGIHRARSGRPSPGQDLEARVEAMAGAFTPTAGVGRTIWRLLLGVSFLTAVASFIYEIGWIRMLSLVMGSATHSFELMLSAFILGLALGALFIRRLTDGAVPPLSLLGWVQWFMGLAALATLPVYASTFGFMAFLVDTLPTTDGGYLLFNLARYGIAIAVMLPSSIMAGMTLPLITATLLHARQGERSIGWVYGVNTLGSVTGVILAGLVLLPWLGVKGMILAGAVLDMGLGILLLAYQAHKGMPRMRLATVGALAGAIVAALGIQWGLELDRRLLSSGVFRYAALPTEAEEPVLFYKDGRTASVGVHLSGPQDLVVMTTNGKPDASISLRWVQAQGQLLSPQPIVYDDEATQTLLALIPLAHAPGARSAAHIGHGSGLTGHVLLGAPGLERSVTVEIEPEMIAASEAFYPANARTFEDPRSTFVIDDAKSFFASRPDRFDLIISEPSNPWVSGTSSLFTVEFYSRVRGYLAPGGVLGQWIHGYEMTDELVTSVLAALHQVFPDYRAYMVGPADLVIVASGEGPLSDPDWSVFEIPDIRRTLAHVPPMTPRLLESLFLFDRATLGPMLDRWTTVNSDFFPHLDLGAERARYMKRGAHGYMALGEPRTHLPALLKGEPRGFGEGWDEPVLEVMPFQELAMSSWLRWARFEDLTFAEAPTERHEAALEEYQALSSVLNLGQGPADWKVFSHLAARVERTLHGGTSGVVDSLFYGRLFEFIRQNDAPLEARASADFIYGVAAWEHERASRAAEILLEAEARAEEWVPRTLLLAGSVWARLALGDGEGARRVMEVVGNPWSGNEGDLRWTLLNAWVDRGSLFDPPPP